MPPWLTPCESLFRVTRVLGKLSHIWEALLQPTSHHSVLQVGRQQASSFTAPLFLCHFVFMAKNEMFSLQTFGHLAGTGEGSAMPKQIPVQKLQRMYQFYFFVLRKSVRWWSHAAKAVSKGAHLHNDKWIQISGCCVIYQYLTKPCCARSALL